MKTRPFVVVLASIFFTFASQLAIASAEPRFEIVFTSPECRVYPYSGPVRTQSGQARRTRPRNAFCTVADQPGNLQRPNGPARRILDLVSAPSTKDVFVASFTYSFAPLTDALCEAVKRGVKVTFVLDKGQAQREAQRLATCRGPDGNAARIVPAGNGSSTLHHNKLIIVNGDDPSEIAVVFGSGNFSGHALALHQENWNFVRIARQTHFAETHRCIRDGLLRHGEKAGEYGRFVASCRAGIPYPEDPRLRVFVVPNEGKRALEAIAQRLNRATHLGMAAREYTLKEIEDMIAVNIARRGLRTALVLDDDFYWARYAPDQEFAMGQDDYERMMRWKSQGVGIRFFESNGEDRIMQHNKYMVFWGGGADGVFTGNGNFTKGGFARNFEILYLIGYPEVVRAYRQDIDRLWQLATPEDLMPVDYVPLRRSSGG